MARHKCFGLFVINVFNEGRRGEPPPNGDGSNEPTPSPQEQQSTRLVEILKAGAPALKAIAIVLGFAKDGIDVARQLYVLFEAWLN